MTRRNADSCLPPCDRLPEVDELPEVSERCQVCWIHHTEAERTQPTGLQRMHVIPRSKRRCDDPWNTLVGCSRCHGNQHGPNAPGWAPLTLPMLLFVKRESGVWHPHKLAALYCRALPDLEALPEIYMRERAKHQPIQSIVPNNGELSAEAEQAMLDPFWLPTWDRPSYVSPPTGEGWYEVREKKFQGAKVIGKGKTDFEAVRAAIEWNRNRSGELASPASDKDGH